MTYQPGSRDMQIFDGLPPIVRRAMREAIVPPLAEEAHTALVATNDPHGVASRIRTADHRRRCAQEYEIDETLQETCR